MPEYIFGLTGIFIEVIRSTNASNDAITQVHP